jgi:hypothetical protein
MDLNPKNTTSRKGELETSLTLMHQNIIGLNNKDKELICPLLSNNINPHIICVSEQYTSDQIYHILNLKINMQVPNVHILLIKEVEFAYLSDPTSKPILL